MISKKQRLLTHLSNTLEQEWMYQLTALIAGYIIHVRHGTTFWKPFCCGESRARLESKQGRGGGVELPLKLFHRIIRIIF